jgi:hypothetical protein
MGVTIKSTDYPSSQPKMDLILADIGQMKLPLAEGDLLEMESLTPFIQEALEQKEVGNEAQYLDILRKAKADFVNYLDSKL